VALLALALASCRKEVAAVAPAVTADAAVAVADAGVPLAAPKHLTLADAPAEAVLRADLHELLGAPDAEARLVRQLETSSRQLRDRLVRVAPVSHGDLLAQLTRLVAENLEAKRGLGLTYDERRISRQIIDYEVFKLETFVATGVFPKRYFGYLDEQGDTAAYEVRLEAAARKAARACNAWLEQERATFRVTEQEVVVTFLAEGGAILLREDQAQLEAIHPVQGIGLDDIASGFEQLGPLVRQVDAEAGTHLGTVVERRDGRKLLARLFTFEEAVAGTAVMWVWEKRIAERKLVAKGRAPLAGRPLDEQFVIASLVYNSGVLFEEKTIQGLRSLQLGDYLADLSVRSKAKYPELPVLAPKASLALLIGGGDYPEQPTSWSAVYHVLQRYGAYVALARFTDAFDEQGRLRSAPSAPDGGAALRSP